MVAVLDPVWARVATMARPRSDVSTPARPAASILLDMLARFRRVAPGLLGRASQPVTELLCLA
jgi:hypothetical protein